MINAIRLRTLVESEDVRIPELARLVGKRVEILVVEDEAPGPFADEGKATASDVQRTPRLGTLRGLVDIPEDFDDPLPVELLRAFERGAEG
jgi:hypothetical protein